MAYEQFYTLFWYVCLLLLTSFLIRKLEVPGGNQGAIKSVVVLLEDLELFSRVIIVYSRPHICSVLLSS